MERQRDVRGLAEPAAPAALAGTLPARYTHVGTAAGHPTEGGCRLWRRVRGRLRTRKWVGGGGVPLGSPLRRPNEPCWDGSARGGGSVGLAVWFRAEPPLGIGLGGRCEQRCSFPACFLGVGLLPSSL